MNFLYVSQVEIEAHKAAMQRVVEEEKREQEEINDKRKKAIKDANDKKKAAINEAMKMQNKFAAMQKDFEFLPLLCQVYHEAPNDVFELIVLKCSDRNGREGRQCLQAGK